MRRQPSQRWGGVLALFFVVLLAFAPLRSIHADPAVQPAPQAAPPAELHEALIGQINKLNPLFAAANPVDRDIVSLIFEGLTTVNQYGEVVPDLATNWTISSDGLEYVFRLRQDVLWQDGIPFTSADVAYTIRTLRSRDFPGDADLRDFWRTVEMDVIDEFTIRFRLVQPLASFPEYLRQGIVPVHALEGAPVATLHQHPFNLSPIGTGAYQIENRYTAGGVIRGVSLRVAPNYRLRPEGATGYALDRIVFTTYPDVEAALAAFQSGEVNSLGNIPAGIDISSLPNTSLYTTLAPGMGIVLFNWNRDSLAYFRDQDMRLAFTQATNREQIVLDALSGRAIPADSPIPANSWAFNPAARYPAYNPDAARALIEQVSFDPPTPVPTAPPPAEGAATTEATPLPPPSDIRRDFKILVVDDPGIAGIAFEIANQWNVLGFTVSLDMVDGATLRSRLESGDFDVALVEYNFEPLADPDQFALWHQGQYQVGQNYSGIKDLYLSDLLVKGRTNPYGIDRKKFYDEFQMGFAARVPALVLYNPLYSYLTDARLQGVQLDFLSSPADRFNTIQNWFFS